MSDKEDVWAPYSIFDRSFHRASGPFGTQEEALRASRPGMIIVCGHPSSITPILTTYEVQELGGKEFSEVARAQTNP